MTNVPSKRAVEIVEVGPRDGFQGIGPFIPTETKIAMLRRLAAAGLNRIEIGSFVSASAVPQLRDTPELLAACAAIPGLIPQVLVPSERRGQDAVQAGAPWLVFVLSVTEAHNRNNVRRHPLESVEEYQRLLAPIPPTARCGSNIATAFDCPFTGRVPEAETLALLDRLIQMRADVEICLCDTTGRADPDHVDEPVRPRAWRALPMPALGDSTRTTLTASGLPTSTPPTVRKCACSMLRSAGWVAARSRPAPPAMSRPRMWSGCSSAWGLRPGLTLMRSFWSRAMARASPGGLPGGRVRDALTAQPERELQDPIDAPRVRCGSNP